MPNRDSNGRFVSGGGTSKISDRQTSAYVEMVSGTRPTNVTIKAGILDVNPSGGPSGADEHDAKSGLTIADIANIQEFGLGVPERSFIRAWVDSHGAQISAKAAEVFPLAMAGKLTWQQAGDQIALWAGAEIQKYISDGSVTPPNAAATIAKKGSSVPLIDQGVLRSAITGEAILS